MKNKRIILLFDGTWQEYFDQSSEYNDYWSNVQKIRCLIAEYDTKLGVHQIAFYFRGVGTGHVVNKIVDTVDLKGVDNQIIDAYMTLCDNYVEGDEIFIFGYSRGAVAARSLTGMIDCCGLLKGRYSDKIDVIWKYFNLNSAERVAQYGSKKLGNICHKKVYVNFLGVWDTVLGAKIEYKKSMFGLIEARVGARLDKNTVRFDTQFPSLIVKNSYHALAIDERRGVFEPLPWKPRADGAGRTNVMQVWFAGCHSDVGGGNKSQGLSDISLDWMIRKSKRHGLVFHETMIKRLVNEDITAQFCDSHSGWIKLDINHRTINFDGFELLGERVHSSVMALYGQTTQYNSGPEEFIYQPTFLKDRKASVRKEQIEDYEKIQKYKSLIKRKNNRKFGIGVLK